MTQDAKNSIAQLVAQSTSASFRALNAHLLPVPPDRPRPAAKPKRTIEERLQSERPIEKADPGRYLVRIESVRRTLLDEDNLIPKWHVDALRYAGLLHSDAPGACSIRTTQRKTLPGEAEHVVITIDRAPSSA